MKRLLHLIVGCLIASPFVFAGEYVVLSNGFRLHADRHEIDGSVVKIFSGTGVVEMPLDTVATYELEEKTDAASGPPAAEMKQNESLSAKPRPRTPAELASEAAKKYVLPDAFVRSVMKAESGFHPDAVSSKGAIGLMQLMPDTARQLGVDPHDPGQNAEGGAQYLRELLAKYENDPDQVLLALAAYNAGPHAVERYHGVPPYPETRAYILRILKDWEKSDRQQ